MTSHAAGARDVLLIDGSHGEGGGQVLRTALSLAALTGRAIRIENIRARRRKAGLAAQHLTAVRAAAQLCGAVVDGDSLDSQAVAFVPAGPVRSGDYLFDVAAARLGGSAGAVTLVLQTVLLPLALAAGESRVVIRGGTHLPWSPPYDYVAAIWLPLLRRLGVTAAVSMARSGWYPIGQGEIEARIAGLGVDWRNALRPLDLSEPGRLLRIGGRALAANLPAHIPQRMVDRARTLLLPLGAELELAPERTRAACPGAGIFLTAEYENVACGFSTLGMPGKPSEEVAEEGAAALLGHATSAAAVDMHLADQILMPLAIATGPSQFSTEQPTLHLATNAWVIRQFGLAETVIERRSDGTGVVRVEPADQRADTRTSI